MNSSKKKLFCIIFLSLFFNIENLVAEKIGIGTGEKLYEKHCSDCHSLSLRGSAHGNELVGEIFLEKWKDNYKGLYSLITKTMPPGDKRKISNYEYVEILSYILKKNYVENINLTEIAGINNDEEWVSFSDPSTIDRPEDRKSLFENKELDGFIDLSIQDINYPNVNDWTSWRRTPLSHGYTPLTNITKKNIKDLKLSWSLTMAEGSNQGTPLVYNGIMFLTHPDNIIQAINAKNGDLIWEYKYNYEKGSKTLGGPTRNIAIFKNKIFLATYDAHLIALDAESGNLLWKTKKANYKDGYTHTSGPIIADGIVVSGINGCERYIKDGCFITGHDPETGKEIWRTSTIALPGDPNSESWGNTPPLYRSGSDMWIAGSYDPELKLFYIGTSQAKPWVAASRGMTPREAALYTNSTLALNPKTGEIIWYFQHIPGETIDMEVGFERILINENNKKFLITIGKDGIIWKLNRENGTFIQLKDTMNQDIYSDIDTKYGKVKYRDDILNSEIGKAFSACPGIYGGHNWQSASYDNNSKIIIIPLHQLCSDMIGRKVDMSEGGGGYGGDSKTYKMPNKKPGKIIAINSSNLDELWSFEQEALFLTSALTTKSGITFIGDLDRKFKAFDTLNGDLLWETTLNSAVHGYPISFGIDGKQYIAVTTGMGVFRALTSNLSPEIYQPEGGNTIYVFVSD